VASYVYCITNNVDGKKYVGKSNNPFGRLNRHVISSKAGTPKSYVARAIKLYGIDQFTFDILGEYSTEEEAYEYETKFILEFKSNDSTHGYNLTVGGQGIKSPSDETRLKMSTSHMRRIDASHPDAKPKPCSGCENMIYPHAALTASRLKGFISQKFCSRRCSTLYRNKKNSGLHRSEDVRLKISKSMTGKHRPELQNRFDINDFEPKFCIRCSKSFLPHEPITLGSVKAFNQRRWCSSLCATHDHNVAQREQAAIRRRLRYDCARTVQPSVQIWGHVMWLLMT
jgi:group I intron endonuclease